MLYVKASFMRTFIALLNYITLHISHQVHSHIYLLKTSTFCVNLWSWVDLNNPFQLVICLIHTMYFYCDIFAQDCSILYAFNGLSSCLSMSLIMFHIIHLPDILLCRMFHVHLGTEAHWCHFFCRKIILIVKLIWRPPHSYLAAAT